MSIFTKLITLFRGTAHEAGAAVVDANALRILDQEIRDADNALGRARDDLATLVAKRRMLEKELQGLQDQAGRYESSARAALAKGDESLALEVATRISELESEVGLKTPQLADMRSAEERMHQTIAATQQRVENLRREIDVVKVNDSVQRAQAAVASQGAERLGAAGLGRRQPQAHQGAPGHRRREVQGRRRAGRPPHRRRPRRQAEGGRHPARPFLGQRRPGPPEGAQGGADGPARGSAPADRGPAGPCEARRGELRLP